MAKIRVLLAEDHEIVRHGLRLLINGQPDMEVVGEAKDGRVAVEQAGILKPTVAVVDVSMPDGNGLAATKGIRESAPATAVVALTRYADDAYVQELMKAGALGYVLKQSPSAELVNAVRSVAAGRPYLDQHLAARAKARSIERHGRTEPQVTDREASVLRLMALGHSNKEIGVELSLSVKTVEVHKANGMRKLGLTGRTDLVRYAVLQGWLREP